jgi:hypothetical protein
MSMSISPTSDPVVLFWDDAWWLPGRNDPVPFQDPEHAAAELAASWSFASRKLQVLFEPAGFRTEPADCPQSNRTTLGWALSDQFPDLVNPSWGWSHEPIRAHGDGFSTLLHLEAQPVLLTLLEALAQAGFKVTAVWPVPTWLLMRQPELSDTGNFITALIGCERVCLYHEAADGSRGVVRWYGPDAEDECQAWLKDRLTRVPGTALELVTQQSGLLTHPRWLELVSGGSQSRIVPLVDALDQDVVFSTDHPAQLRFPVARFSASRLATVASWTILLTVLGWSGFFGWSWFQAQQTDVRNLPTLSALRSEVARLRSNAVEIEQLRTLAEKQSPLFPTDLLALLTANLPTEVVFRRFEAHRTGIVVEGWTPPAVPVDSGWIEQLNQRSSAWRWLLTPREHGAFVLKAETV